MATTTTTRLGLVKPTPGTGEPVNRSVMNTDYDKIDAAVGALICTEATKPVTPWDGQFIRTTDTRKLYVWNATQAVWDHIVIPLGGAIEGALSSTDILTAKVTADANNRWKIKAGGEMWWGPGTSTQDTNLKRMSASRLGTDDSFEVVTDLIVGGDATITGDIAVTGIGMERVVRKTTFQNKTSDTALVNDTHLTFANVASGEYVFDLTLYVTGSISGDIKFGFTFPTGAGGATITWMGYGGVLATATQLAPLESAGFVESTTADQIQAYNTHGNGAIIRAEGYIIFGSTVGALTLRWAQNTSNATATSVRKGSRLKYTRVA